MYSNLKRERKKKKEVKMEVSIYVVVNDNRKN